MIYKMAKILLRIINATIFSFKYLKNPFVFLEIPFKKEIKIITMNNEEILIERKKFPTYIEVFQNKWIYENGCFTRGEYKFNVLDPGILLEDFKTMYMYLDLNGKNVLDIGGLYGETSVFFAKGGNANRVFVYEPIRQNYELIIENIKLNNCNNKVIPYNTGLSNKDGVEILESSVAPGTVGFGLPGTQYSAKIKVESWNTVLKRHAKDNIFLAKVDCEGGEKYLMDADAKLISQIPNWVIETHSNEIGNNIIKLFEGEGYRKELRKKVAKGVNVWAFTKQS